MQENLMQEIAQQEMLIGGIWNFLYLMIWKNKLIKSNQNVNIIVYDENANAPNLMKKYDQLIGLGFINVFIYPGGLFEWLLLQDVYGKEDFPTTSNELDILKYKGKSMFTTYLIKDLD